MKEYEAFARRLREEYEAEPSPETQALIAEIREREIARAGDVEAVEQALAESIPLRAADAARDEAEPATKWRVRWPLLAAAVAAMVGVGLIWYVGWGRSANPAAGSKSVAVLPCENISPDPADAYLADGLHEEILIKLSKISSLTSIGRTSIERYRDNPRPLSEMAAELGVGFVGECSVRKDADQDRIRLTFQLLDARTGAHVWAEQYDRELADIFAIQSDVARQIATVLGATLTAEEQAGLEAQPTTNLEAYEYFRSGAEFMEQDSGTTRRPRYWRT